MNHANAKELSELEKNLENFLDSAEAHYLPHLSIDTIIFGFHDRSLKVLLSNIGRYDVYALPGGFIRKKENLDDAAKRILQERTGLSEIYLEQFFTSGHADRAKQDTINKLFKANGIRLTKPNWLDQRFITICYYALIDYTKFNTSTDLFSGEIGWFDLDKIPTLLYDHNLLIEKALIRLQTDLDQKLAGSNLLNEAFTMNELQILYETVFQKKFVRTNFQRKILGLNILDRLDKKYNGKPHKAPYLYRFKMQ